MADTAIQTIEKTTAKFIADDLLKIVIGKDMHKSQTEQDASEAGAVTFRRNQAISFSA